MSFFFSSRRRHTRYWRDWSSDVCSSDLISIRRCLSAATSWTGSKTLLNPKKPTLTRMYSGSPLQFTKSSSTIPILFSRGSQSQRSEEHTSELQSRHYLVCRLLLEKKISSSRLTSHAPTSHRS